MSKFCYYPPNLVVNGLVDSTLPPPKLVVPEGLSTAGTGQDLFKSGQDLEFGWW